MNRCYTEHQITHNDLGSNKQLWRKEIMKLHVKMTRMSEYKDSINNAAVLTVYCALGNPCISIAIPLNNMP